MAEGSFADATLRVFRGDKEGGAAADYRVPLVPGMVVLDALHSIQSHQAPDLAVRWNCKAGKCGSCSAEVNGRPRLTCKTRMDSLPLDQPVTVYPMKAFPLIKDLVTDVSWNYKVNQKIPPFQPRPGVEWKMYQLDGLDRTRVLKEPLGIGFCNITKCCTEVCPEEIHITDNAIIPLKERVVDEFYDPVLMLVRKIRGIKESS